MHDLDRARISEAVDLLAQLAPENRLEAIKNLCLNNGGRWDHAASFEDAPKPCLYEIALFTVPAMATDPADLANNWIRAASNMLGGLEGLAA